MVHDVIIRNVKIQNYRSLENASVSLNKGLNIIIGDNGAGKSNFLSFLDNQLSDQLYKLIYSGNFTEGGRRTNYAVELEYKDDTGTVLLHLTYSNATAAKKIKDTPLPQKLIKITRIENGKKHNEIEIPVSPALQEYNSRWNFELKELKEVLNTTLIRYDIPKRISYISMQGKLTFHDKAMMVEEPDFEYQSAYSSPFNTLYSSPLFYSFNTDIEQEIIHLPRGTKGKPEAVKEIILAWFNKKKRENKYLEFLKKYSPITDIKLNENINVYKADNTTIVENIVLTFKVNNHWVPWSYLSDGTIRLFFIITEILFSNSNIILVEEPELGIHPNQLFKLMDFLKLQSGKKQIIISTHSPISLDVLSPDELNQVIIAKLTKKGTQLQHLTPVQKNKAKAYITKVGNLSAYWLHSDLEQ